MSTTIVIGLLGGLALFLYGMQMMSAGLEAAAGSKMKEILEKLTSNRLKGVLVGAAITAVIQSSSATTVMVVGFVNSGMMTLRQAVWIIMGANIGTTITGQLIALDVGAIAPLIAFGGVAVIMFTKKEKVHHIANIFAGLGILFIGMDMMGNAMNPLRDNQQFISIMTEFENPVLGILAGMIFTAIIQSSSASVGILQTLAGSGIIGLDSAAFVLFGQNIGTCITAFLAAISANRNAKRTTIVHITFNVIGTIIFTTLCLVTPLIGWVEGFTPNNAPAQIANLHTIFNVVTTLLLLPFGQLLAGFAEVILKDKSIDNQFEDEELHYIKHISNINEEKLGVSAISMEGTRLEMLRMFDMAKVNVKNAFDLFVNFNQEKANRLDKKEEYVDYLNKEISKHISRVITHERSEMGSVIYNAYFTMTSNIERVSDHAENIAGYARQMNDKGMEISEYAKQDVARMKAICEDFADVLFENTEDVVDWHKRVASIEQQIDDMTEEFRSNMYTRMQKGICNGESHILFSEMVTDFERIGDHYLNISDEIMRIKLAGA
ncbi:MAG: Na/Pi cotransporter family protein [Lachnospiraceae bacterium]|nr:Na/Pi cotransporter family protein [Lachnospiraceae bacterium]